MVVQNSHSAVINQTKSKLCEKVLR